MLDKFYYVYVPKNRYILINNNKLRSGNLILLNKNKLNLLNCISCPFTYMRNCNQLIVVIKCSIKKLNNKIITIFSTDLTNKFYYDQYNIEFKNDSDFLNDNNHDLELYSYNYLYKLIYEICPNILQNKNELVLLIGKFNINKFNENLSLVDISENSTTSNNIYVSKYFTNFYQQIITKSNYDYKYIHLASLTSTKEPSDS
jgi:hypothetical protein